MLTALNKQHKLITLIRLSDEEVAVLRGQSFFCPECHSRVIIKAGEIKIPHFAHRTGIGCEGSHEPETSFHLRGKKLLFHHFSSIISSVALEQYLPAIKQRPDVYISMNEKKYAVEYQCAVIGSEDFLTRTKGYQYAEIEPVWILGSRIQTKGAGDRISLTHSQQQFIRYSPHAGYWLAYLDAETGIMHFYYNLIPLTTKLFTSETLSLPLASVSFPFQLPSKSEESDNINHFIAAKDYWIKNKLMYNNGVNDKFLKSLYMNRDHLLSLPEFIGIPTQHMILFKNHPIEWQYYVWYDGFKKKERGSNVRVMELYRCLQSRMSTGLIQCRIFPLVKEELRVEALKEYLMILEKREILRKISKEEYMVTGRHTK
ncbi:MAG: competence protein CoiA family protein [Bacillota bacterium]